MPVFSALAAIGVALGATVGTATAVVVGGVVAGAVLGGVTAAVTGGNIMKGVLVGGLIGGAVGGLGAMAGLGVNAAAPAVSATAPSIAPAAAISADTGLAAAGTTNGALAELGGTQPLWGGAHASLINSAPVATSGMTVPQAMLASSALSGVGGAAKGYMEGDAANDAAKRANEEYRNRVKTTYVSAPQPGVNSPSVAPVSTTQVTQVAPTVNASAPQTSTGANAPQNISPMSYRNLTGAPA
jgi:hypothetical protein